jgi:outer membrane receptor for ferrienterochelin and colicins
MMNSLRNAARPRSAPWAALVILVAPVAHAQTLSGTIIVRVTADSTPLSGAAIAAGASSGVTDQSGLATFKLPTGRHTFRVSQTGFRPESLAVFVGVGTTKVTIPVHRQPVRAEAPHAAPAPVTPTASPTPVAPATLVTRRDDRKTTDGPTYVEVGDRDALDEQIDRAPGNIADMLGTFSGVRVQPLSAGSGGDGIRIRGMPGRYTKILMDGLPLFGATPEGQDPLQIPVLGVDRVEVIPGVTSALYGPTSLSGSVNVVSAPATAPSQVVVNGTTHEASDVAVFQTYTFSPEWAGTLLASRDYANPADPDGDGWAEVAGYKRIVVQPRVYWAQSPTSSWFMTGGWTTENRRSGTFGNARLPDFNKYSDDADTRRANAGTVGKVQLDTNTVLTVRAAITREWRTRWYGDDQERDRRNEIFGDVSITKSLGDNVLVGGVAIDRDQYSALDVRDEDYRYTTPALYGEYTWSPDPRFAITSSARLDLQSQFGDFVSPRISVVGRPSPEWEIRVSRANGVYAPTPLTDETEAFGLAQLQSTTRQAEHALGWSLDVDHTKGALELGGSAYRTVVSHPLIVRVPPGSAQGYQLVNSDEPSVTQGIDLRARYRLAPFVFTAGYSYIDAHRPQIAGIFGDNFEIDTTLTRTVPYNPRHSLNVDWAYEREQDKVLGVSAHFVGRQVLADSSFGVSSPYVTLDARLEKHVRRVVLFVYAKDLTGVHQLQLGPVLRTASGAAGQWDDNVWAPLDGRVFNAGLRFSY